MKILHVLHGWPPEHVGGTECYVQRLSAAQSAAGHDVAVAAGSTTDRYAEFQIAVEGAVVPVYRISQRGAHAERWDHGAAPHVEACFAELLGALAPELVHVHHWMRSTRALVRRAAAAGIPSVVTAHDLAATCPRRSRVRADEAFCERPLSVESCLACVPRETWMPDALVAARLEHYAADMLAELAQAAVVVAPSRAHARLLARFSGLPEDRFDVLPHPGSVDWRAPAREPWKKGARRLRLALWGHLRPSKGAHVLLEALAALGRPDEVELAVWGRAGDPAYDAVLDALARGLTVERREAFDHEALAELRADAAVIPSLQHEPHSFVLDEALALGLPLLVSDRGALPERCGRGGIAFRPGDAGALARAIARLLDEPGLLAALGAALPRPEPLARHVERLTAIYARARSAPRVQARRDGAREVADLARWERAGAELERAAREHAGMRAAAEREVRALRKDVAETFSRLYEVKAELGGRRVDLAAAEERKRELETALVAAQAERLSLTEQLAQSSKAIAGATAALAHEERLRADLERELADMRRELEAERGELAAARSELAEERRELAEARATLAAKAERIAHLERREQKLMREHWLALPLIVPAKGILWLWDRVTARDQEPK